jgi:hypothetical protein
VTKLQELLDGISTVKALLEEVEAIALRIDARAENLAHIGIRKARLDVFCEIAASYQNGTLDEPRRQRFEQFLNEMTQETLLRSLDTALSKAH